MSKSPLPTSPAMEGGGGRIRGSEAPPGRAGSEWLGPTWKTLMRACGKLSKLLRRTSVSSKSYLPPKSCMPSRAKMTMKRKSSSSSEAMERMELSRDATRLLSDVQYLEDGAARGPEVRRPGRLGLPGSKAPIPVCHFILLSRVAV